MVNKLLRVINTGGSKMGKKKLWCRSVIAAAAALLMMQGCLQVPGNLALAEEQTAAEQTEAQDFLELTAQELETEEGSAVSARLTIGDWLDYGDYGIERTDIPGTDYLFSITTKDGDENLIDDGQLAYCLQSYFLTPLPGDHSGDMTDQVAAIGGSSDVQKVFYYGYGGAGYDADEFVEFLAQSDEQYYEDVYLKLSESEQAELAYIITHGAASYAYFTDGTSFERYLELQFEVKYGDDWEEQLGYFEEQELELAGIEDGDMNLLAATYGMNERGIALSKGWYQLLTEKKAPDLSITEENGTYCFNGNEKNESLTLALEVPDGFECTVLRADGASETAESGSSVVLKPADSFSFAFTGEAFSAEAGDALVDLIPVAARLSGAEDEIWNLVLLETSKGTRETVSKRQQDIAAVSRIDAGRTELDFDIDLQQGRISVSLTDETGRAVSGAVFEVFYDEACSQPAGQEGEAVTFVTDDTGEGDLYFLMNQKLLDQDGKLYIRETSAPVGYLPDETVYCIGDGECAELTNTREKTALSGTVIWHDNEDADGLRPDSITVDLNRDGETIDSLQISEEEGWKYSFEEIDKYSEDAAKENIYGTGIQVPDGYTAEASEDGTVTLTHPASVVPQIEVTVDVDGRDLKEGEFSFDLTQVTDETGDTELEDGVQRTAVNDPDGRILFDDIPIMEPGTYYYRITKTPDPEDESAAAEEAVIAKAEVTVGGEYQDQLEAVVTYPEGQPEFVYTYTAGGEAVIDGVQVILENGELTEGMFRFELKDSDGNVLQTAENDANGAVSFEPLQFTEAHIGQKMEYTVSEVNDAAEDITYDSVVYTVTVSVEDSESSDGTLQITTDTGDMVFTNVMAEPETETETVSMTETELETVPETETETAQMTGAENQDGGYWGVMWTVFAVIVILLLILFFVWKKMQNKK